MTCFVIEGIVLCALPIVAEHGSKTVSLAMIMSACSLAREIRAPPAGAAAPRRPGPAADARS